MATSGVISMPRGGFGKGRPRQFGAPMVGKQIVMPTEMWEKVEERAQEESNGRQVSQAEIVRRAVDSFFKAEKPRVLEIELKGAIFGGKADTIRPADDKPMLAVPPTVEGVTSDMYALWVVGASMQSDYGISIPDGAYAFFKPTASVAPGAIVHVQWEVKGEMVCTLKQYIPQPGGAMFRALNEKTTPREQFRKLDEFRIVGEYRGHWGGKA